MIDNIEKVNDNAIKLLKQLAEGNEHQLGMNETEIEEFLAEGINNSIVMENDSRWKTHIVALYRHSIEGYRA